MELDSLISSYICFSNLPNNVILESNVNEKYHLHTNHKGYSSSLYLSKNSKLLLKVEKIKYKARVSFFNWFFRDLMRRFFVFGVDAKREFNGYRIVKSIGLNTPILYCWGMPLSLFSDTISFILIEYRNDTIMGSDYFNKLTEDRKKIFVKKLGSEALSLATMRGYIHRDFHLNNFLVDNCGEIVWIDIHLRKLSISKKKRWKQIVNSFNSSKVGGEEYKNILISLFEEKYHC